MPDRSFDTPWEKSTGQSNNHWRGELLSCIARIALSLVMVAAGVSHVTQKTTLPPRFVHASDTVTDV